MSSIQGIPPTRTAIADSAFREIHVAAPAEVCESRDPKGLYKKARAGQIPNMTGINSAYEAPLHAEIRIDTTQATPSESVSLMKAKLTQ